MTKGQHYRNILHVFAVNCLLLLNVYPGPLAQPGVGTKPKPKTLYIKIIIMMMEM